MGVGLFIRGRHYVPGKELYACLWTTKQNLKLLSGSHFPIAISQWLSTKYWLGRQECTTHPKLAGLLWTVERLPKSVYFFVSVNALEPNSARVPSSRKEWLAADLTRSLI